MKYYKHQDIADILAKAKKEPVTGEEKAKLLKFVESHLKQYKEKPYADFERFREAYPGKIVKKTALSSWSRLRPSEELLGVILRDIQNRFKGEWKDKEKAYIPHATTYLNQRRWEDEENEEQVRVSNVKPFWQKQGFKSEDDYMEYMRQQRLKQYQSN